MKLIETVTLILAISLLSSCGDDSVVETKKQAPPKSDISEVGDSAKLEPVSQEMLPSPLQVAILFKESGLAFNSANLLDPGLVDKASTELQKLLLLGAYSSDLAMASLHSEKGKAIDRLEMVSNLSMELGFGTRFNSKENLEKFEAHIDNVDSTAHFIASMEYDIEEYIHNNDEEDRSTIIFCGAWLQSLEQGRLNLLDEMNVEVIYQILDQQQIAKLIDLMLSRINDYDNDSAFEKLQSAISNIKDHLNKFDISDIENIELNRTDFDALLLSIDNAHQSIFAL